jgi:RNA recognition motif-containing protein
MNIYVGNVSPMISQRRLRSAFERFGKVDKITLDEQPRNANAVSFCFVEMPFDNQASRAIRELNGKELGGCALAVRASEMRV